MINSDLDEFVELAYLGRTLWFWYDGKKYFYRGWVCDDGIECLYLTTMIPEDGPEWEWKSDDMRKNAEGFFQAKIFNGKSFWEVEQEMEWVDC